MLTLGQMALLIGIGLTMTVTMMLYYTRENRG